MKNSSSKTNTAINFNKDWALEKHVLEKYEKEKNFMLFIYV